MNEDGPLIKWDTVKRIQWPFEYIYVNDWWLWIESQHANEENGRKLCLSGCVKARAMPYYCRKCRCFQIRIHNLEADDNQLCLHTHRYVPTAAGGSLWVSGNAAEQRGKGIFTSMPPFIHNEKSVLVFLNLLESWMENRSHFCQGTQRDRERNGVGGWAGA